MKVPSFSAKDAAGSTTSASLAVSVIVSSTTTRKSSARRACSTWCWSGSVSTGSSPMIISALKSPASAAVVMPSEVSPGACGIGTPQAWANLACTSLLSAG
ncbi:hypothetical protein D3C84_1018940 [compost metagenome]